MLQILGGIRCLVVGSWIQLRCHLTGSREGNGDASDLLQSGGAKPRPLLAGRPAGAMPGSSRRERRSPGELIGSSEIHGGRRRRPEVAHHGSKCTRAERRAGAKVERKARVDRRAHAPPWIAVSVRRPGGRTASVRRRGAAGCGVAAWRYGLGSATFRQRMMGR